MSDSDLDIPDEKIAEMLDLVRNEYHYRLKSLSEGYSNTQIDQHLIKGDPNT